MKLSELKRPKNHKTLIGRPMLFAVMNEVKIKGSNGAARITYNIGTGDYFISGQKNNPKPYVVSSILQAIKFAKSINHYNETNEKLAFKTADIKELELIEIN